ncbi:MAG TPA: NADH-quinone oxidoreductase subunit B, partial [Candidatus Methylacidiphilales bacterium]|nr:NADH-quinone oxidoreductase subunit B [Candidatus Methylacidiphilales bacterium]
LRSELQKAGIIATTLDAIYNSSRQHSIWPLQFGLACCAIEMISTAASRFDLARFGAEVFRPSPRQADLLIVAGTVTKKMAPQVVRLYNQMPEPKYVIAMGVCAISGGPFKEGYNVLKGIDRYIPVDVHIPGCPPRPEALIHALMTLQRKIEAQQTLSATAGSPDANPAYSSARREFPVPVYSGKDLVPPYNPEVWRPPAKPNYTG